MGSAVGNGNCGVADGVLEGVGMAVGVAVEVTAGSGDGVSTACGEPEGWTDVGITVSSAVEEHAASNAINNNPRTAHLFIVTFTSLFLHWRGHSNS